ncbi:MAG TPA: response regulator, partial [Nitrospiria bacterium]
REDLGWQGSGKALIIDDEESVRGLAGEMLEKMGFTVLRAENGREGIDLFRQDPDGIRLVLLDMTMPYLNGEDVFRELQQIQPRVKTILSSGYSEQAAANRFTEKGLAGFIQKPYRYEDLLIVVKKALEK